jgi:TPR repeat protein
MILAALALPACGNLPDMDTAKSAYQAEDYQTARTNYEELSEFGFPRAKIELGKMHLYGKGTEPDPEKALTLFKEAYDGGEKVAAAKLIPRAQTKLGLAAIKDQRPEEGIRLLEMAGAGGDAQAYKQLGKIYEKGVYAPKNGQLAANYYALAEQNGLPATQD